MEELYTGNIRLERMELEYKTLRHMQDQFMDRMDKFNAAFQQLSDEVRANREAIQANREALEEIKMTIAAIIKHLDVPYRPMGFVVD